MSCVDDKDVIGAGIFDQVTLGIASAGCPVTPERADFLADNQVAGAIESEELVGPVCCRDSELCRPDPRGQQKPVAANIDQIIVVIAPSYRLRGSSMR